MVGPGYKGLTLPGDLVDRVDAFVLNNTEGYRTRAEVVADAIRQFLAQKSTQSLRPNDAQEIADRVLAILREQGDGAKPRRK